MRFSGMSESIGPMCHPIVLPPGRRFPVGPVPGYRTCRKEHALSIVRDEFRPAIPRSGWSPPVGYQTVGLDKEARNRVRLTGNSVTLVMPLCPQQRPRAQWRCTSPTTSVVPGPVLNAVMTESLPPKRG